MMTEVQLMKGQFRFSIFIVNNYKHALKYVDARSFS